MSFFGSDKTLLLATTVLLDLPEGSTRTAIVTAAADKISKKVDGIEKSVKAEKAVIEAVEKESDEKIRVIKAECDAKTKGPKAKVAEAMAAEKALTALYAKLTS